MISISIPVEISRVDTQNRGYFERRYVRKKRIILGIHSINFGGVAQVIFFTLSIEL